MLSLISSLKNKVRLNHKLDQYHGCITLWNIAKLYAYLGHGINVLIMIYYS